MYTVQLLLSAVQAGITLVTELQRGRGVSGLVSAVFLVRYHKCWPEVANFPEYYNFFGNLFMLYIFFTYEIILTINWNGPVQMITAGELGEVYEKLAKGNDQVIRYVLDIKASSSSGWSADHQQLYKAAGMMSLMAGTAVNTKTVHISKKLTVHLIWSLCSSTYVLILLFFAMFMQVCLLVC